MKPTIICYFIFLIFKDNLDFCLSDVFFFTKPLLTAWSKYFCTSLNKRLAFSESLLAIAFSVYLIKFLTLALSS